MSMTRLEEMKFIKSYMEIINYNIRAISDIIVTKCIELDMNLPYRNRYPEFDISFETFLKENGLAILWSYIRPIVSDMITRGNEFPNFLLPVINIKKMLEEKDSIKLTYE